jgi:hypothetical protein
MRKRHHVFRYLPVGGLLCLLAVSAPACAPKTTTSFPTLLDRDLFLCCTMSFNRDLEANDANYVYPNGVTFRAGTRVRVLGDDDGVLLIQLGTSPTVYRLGYRFGRQRMDQSTWIAAILRDADPTPRITRWPTPAVAAVDAGRLTVGLTKPQTLAARGYPPFHRTESLDADEWIYYDSQQITDTVHFANGRISTITRGRLPDRRFETPLTIVPFEYADPLAPPW